MPASAKPTTKYKWATALIANGPSGGNNRVEYEVRQEEQGWIWTEKPPFETFNQWQYSVGLHIDWTLQNIDAIFAFIDSSTGHQQNTDTGTSQTTFKIGNGGSTNPTLEFNDSTDDAETPYLKWDFSSEKFVVSDTGDPSDEFRVNPNYQQRTTADWSVSEMILAMSYSLPDKFNFSDQSALGNTDEATAKAAAISDLGISSGNDAGDLLSVWWYGTESVGNLVIQYRNFSNYRWTGTWVDLVTSSFLTVKV